jgi:hypothetical protein
MKKWITLTVAASALALAVGCATSKPAQQQAVVCPGCKAQLVHPAGGLELFAYTITDGKQRCPGCQGVLTTRLQEGQWQHKCSICQGAPHTVGNR